MALKCRSVIKVYDMLKTLITFQLQTLSFSIAYLEKLADAPDLQNKHLMGTVDADLDRRQRRTI